jgi:hypothetical protein
MFVVAVPGAAAAATGGGGRRRPAHPGRRSGRRHQRPPGIAEGTEHIRTEHARAKITIFEHGSMYTVLRLRHGGTIIAQLSMRELR